ncbi:hypothetical protein Xen7305DRAFT_00005520 [Xenococcus sp. PCC 7305]|uniref:hypothetical protein n=1 Tax=Xenococcus sp. PCC 7305 TaxID=102125 RepID=UPI0002AC0467|nr:hypothetical protein [Xenococcus sp. PCC 7305]ELS00851.1 hypothetical protein Xen7305DRAFT_00005520 [Xenococcus sp. PCC 7305]
MQKFLTEWGLYILIAIFPGIVNVIAAWQEFNKQSRFLPFFKPLKSSGFWLWLFLQFITPTLLFWWISDFNSKPKIDIVLVFEAIVLGIGFVAILNASTEVGTLSFSLKPVYNFFVDIAYNLIAKEQTRHTAKFWNDVEIELNQSSNDLNSGFDYLKNYLRSDLSLRRKLEELEKKLEQLNKTQNKAPRLEQVKDTISLIEDNVRRGDLQEVLRNFNCSQQLIDKYFNES